MRLKSNGALIQVIPSQRDNLASRLRVEALVRQVLTAHLGQMQDIGGFAFIVWDSDMGATADCRSNGAVPSAVLPEFAKTHLLATKIEQWMIETLREVDDG